MNNEADSIKKRRASIKRGGFQGFSQVFMRKHDELHRIFLHTIYTQIREILF